MPGRKEVRLSGFGGQGVVLAGVILARAAAIYEDIQATQNQSHGAESRGGACISDVVISPEKIDYPMCVAPDVLVAMSPEAATKHVPLIRPGGILIVDEDMVPEVPEGRYSKLYRVPATRVATEELEKRIVANMVMLGTLVALEPVVSRESLEKAVRASAPKGTEDLNLQALRRGFQLGEAARG